MLCTYGTDYIYDLITLITNLSSDSSFFFLILVSCEILRRDYFVQNTS